ncbi:MAG: glycosyltransferase family 4 protein [Candidatus Helarchaeota archaeon]
MKIAIITDVFFPYIAGGAEKRYYEICRRLSKNNEIHIYTQQWKNTKKEEKLHNIHIHRLNYVSKLYTRTGRRKIIHAIVYSVFLFFKLLKAPRFDIIECNLFPYFPCLIGKLFSIIKKSKFCILFHEVWGNYWYQYFSNDLFAIIGRSIEIISSHLTKNIITYTPTIKNRINKIFKIPKKFIYLIPSGVDIRLFNKVPKNKVKNQIIFIGRLIPEKKVDILLKAMKLIKNHLTILIIGEGPLKLQLKKLIKKEKNHKILYLGIQNYNNITKYLSESSVFVLPSIREGQGIVFLESMAARTPVIGVYKEDSGVKDIIKNNYNGFLIKKDDISDLAYKIELLLSNKNLYIKFQENGYNYAKKFSWEKISNLQYIFYLSLLHKSIQFTNFEDFWKL